MKPHFSPEKEEMYKSSCHLPASNDKKLWSLPEASLFEIRGIFTEYKLETPICQVTANV